MLARYLAVEEGRSIGLSWRDAYRYTAELLIATSAGSVGPWTIAEQHFSVTRN